MINTLSKKNVIEKILKESKDRDLKHIEIIELEQKLFFKGDNRQLLIFQLIRNHILSIYENVKIIGMHKIIYNNISISWNSETNETIVE